MIHFYLDSGAYSNCTIRVVRVTVNLASSVRVGLFELRNRGSGAARSRRFAVDVVPF
jgi:hypothetical protein